MGGSATHTLSVDELATHSHGVKTDIDSSEFNIEWPPYAEYTYGWTQDSETTIAPASQTTQVGKSQPFSIMPPYLAVYVWKRIA
jgi:microcystin-dependent protein